LYIGCRKFDFHAIYKRWKRRVMNGTKAMNELGLKRPTFFNL
jgi:hypothetical protein